MAVQLTNEAIAQIKEVINSQKMNLEETYIRIGIQGHSCSGVQYAFGLDDHTTDQDELSVQEDLKVVFDKKYQEELSNIVIDYKNSSEKQGFVLTDLNRKSCSKGDSCCGNNCGNDC